MVYLAKPNILITEEANKIIEYDGSFIHTVAWSNKQINFMQSAEISPQGRSTGVLVYVMEKTQYKMTSLMNLLTRLWRWNSLDLLSWINPIVWIGQLICFGRLWWHGFRGSNSKSFVRRERNMCLKRKHEVNAVWRHLSTKSAFIMFSLSQHAMPLVSHQIQE